MNREREMSLIGSKLRIFNLLFLRRFDHVKLKYLNSIRCHSNAIKEDRSNIKLCSSNKSITNQYTIRSHNCGDLSKQHVNENVCLAGWIQFNRFNKFLILRDRYGSVQLIIKDKKLLNQLKEREIKLKDELRLESVIIIEGKVILRPADEVNKLTSNGDIEVDVKQINFINKCDKELPINYNSLHKTSEDLCLKYRYIQLRSSDLQLNLQSRSEFIHAIRRFLIEQLQFIELETPTLFKCTPGGANEFVIPTRFKDKYYTLTQSPQQFKQLLQIASFDKYFQIARCYRDELTRSDRQPEFTQLDLELSFTRSELIQQLIEDLLKQTWLKELDCIRTPFKRMCYKDCIAKYGSDKPDLRLQLQLNDLTSRNESNEQAFAIRIKHGLFLESSILDRIKMIAHEKLNHHSKSARFISYLSRIESDGKLINEKIQSTANDDASLNENDLKLNNNLIDVNLEANDCLILCIGDLVNLNEIVGRIRNSIIPLILNDKRVSEANGLCKDKYSFLWVIDFPLFSKDESGNLESYHHPFTAPIEQHKQLIYEDPLDAIGQHYDLVLNGNEIGGGSIRIHEYAMQRYVFENLMKSDVSQMSYFLDALNSGCPPHGGIALGLDRLLSIMLNTNSIRDVIAFPKTTFGKDLMCESPNELDAKTKSFYNLI